MSQTPDYAAVTQRAIHSGHPELTYQAEQRIRDGASQDEAAQFLATELDNIYGASDEPDPDVTPDLFDPETPGSPLNAEKLEQERLADANAAAVGADATSDVDAKPETAKQRKARLQAEESKTDSGDNS